MKYYVVVADAAQARLIAADAKLEQFEEREDFAHDDSRLHNRDLRSDQPGRMQAFPGGPQSAVEEEGHHRHELEVFARQLAERLLELLNEGRYEKLVLVAPPRFLGILRAALPDRVAACVTDAVHHDLVRYSAPEVMSRVKEALAT